MHRITTTFVLTSTLLLLSACDKAAQNPSVPQAAATDTYGFSAPSAATIAHNREFQTIAAQGYDKDRADALRGLLAQPSPQTLTNAKGEMIWQFGAYDFVQGVAPNSANPSLWRQESLNSIQGLFQVTEGVYQLRGFDLANMTIIEGEQGWIIIDPLTSTETAEFALNFARQHLGNKPISAIVFTHSHIDHFGGALGIATPEQAAKQGIRIIAPSGFMEAATSENVIAGIAMGRRAAFMYGFALPRSERGHIGSGLGKHPAMGTFGILEPTETVNATGEELLVDGVKIVFQMVPESEAPAEFTFYLPEKNLFLGAELLSRNMHNLYSLRGTQVRDALRWSGYIDEALQLFGKADIMANSHHWPVWGNDDIRQFMTQQRDMYRYLHNQTVHLINQGFNGTEIAETLTLPEPLAQPHSNRGYYGSVPQNAKAIYQYYMGWFDGNPAKLNPLPATETAPRYVALAGGEAALLAKAQTAAETGQYRWAAELLNHLVFANPQHTHAKNVLAGVYDQLGYQAESGPWRNVYLSAAYELRHGKPAEGVDARRIANILANTSLDKIFSSMAVRLNAHKALGKNLQLSFIFTDIQQHFVIRIENGVMAFQAMPTMQPEPNSKATLRITRSLFNQLITGQEGAKALLFSDETQIDGNLLALVSFFGMIEKPDGLFNLVTPRGQE